MDTWSLVALAGFLLLVVTVTNEIAFARFEAQVPRFAAQAPLLRRINVVVRVLAVAALTVAVVFRIVEAVERRDVTPGYIVGGIVVIAVLAGLAAGYGALAAWIMTRR